MKNLLLAIGLIGWVLWGFQLYHHHHRTADVRAWAEATFDEGCTNARFSDEVRQYNKKFMVDTVVAAHNGAWD